MTAPGGRPATPWPPRVLPGSTVIPLVFRASMTEMVRRRTFVFMALVCSLPLLLTFIWRSWGTDYFTPVVFFTNLVSSFYLQLLVYVVGLAFGIPAVHAEVQARTLTYLFTRPVRKAHVYTGRLLAVQLTAGGLLAASLVVCFAVMVVGNLDALSIEFVKVYVNHVFIVLVATVCITAVCAIWGTALRRPVVWGLLWAFGWESIVSKFPGRLQEFTINFHIRNLLLGQADIQRSLVDAFRMLLTDQTSVSPWVSILALLTFLMLSIAAGGLVFSRREYVIG
jgi:ABC-type transport system involved in multi-copper enzyme maturation permease subunit